jgi:hypothetical protein
MFTKTSFLQIYIYICNFKIIPLFTFQLVDCQKVRFRVDLQWRLQPIGTAIKIAPSIRPSVCLSKRLPADINKNREPRNGV